MDLNRWMKRWTMAKLRHGSAALGIGDDTLITQDGVETDVYGNPAGGEQVNAGIYNGESVDPLPDAEIQEQTQIWMKSLMKMNTV